MPKGDPLWTLLKHKALVAAVYDFFEPYNRRPRKILSLIGSHVSEIL